MNRVHWLIVSAWVFAFVSLDFPAMAQTEDEESAATREVIIVTARKREETVQAIPEAVVAIDGSTIEKASITNLEHVGRFVPNVNLNVRQDQLPNVTVRGIGSFGNVQGVGFYVDGVQNFTDQSTVLFDLDRIEVLKGPQGTLYGGSNIGGAIRFITRQPADEYSARIFGEIGQQKTRNIGAVVNFPLTDNLFVRISGNSRQHDGMLTNTERLGRPAVDYLDETAFRAAVRFEPDERTDITLKGRWVNNDTGANTYIAPFDINDFRLRQSSDSPNFQMREVLNGGLVFRRDFDLGELTLIADYTTRDFRLQSDNDYLPTNFFFSRTQAADDILSPNEMTVSIQELRFVSAEMGRFSWIAGLYRLDFEDDTEGFFFVNCTIFAPCPTDPPDFVEGTSGDGFFAIPLGGVAQNKSLAAYLTVTGEFGPLEATLAGRVERSKVTAVGIDDFSVEFLETLFLPKASLSYHVTPDIMLYATYSEGFQPGGGNLSALLAPDVRTIREETSKTIEIGVKTQLLSDRLLINLAAFRTKSEDRQLESTIATPEGFVDGIFNVGDATIKGLEAELHWLATEGLTIHASVGLIDATWDSGSVFQLQDIGGLDVPDTPEYQLAAGVAYQADISDDWTVNLRADVSHSGETIFTFSDVSRITRWEPYTVVSARAGFGPSSGRWELAVVAENLFDEGYFREYYPGFVEGLQATIPSPLDGNDLASRGQRRLVTVQGVFNF